MDDHCHSVAGESEAGGSTSSSLGLLDAEHMAVFRKALDNVLHSDVAETTFAEVIDGLPTDESWLDFDVWQKGHLVEVLGHEQLCAGTREKARRLRAEFDAYILSFPVATLRDFQQALPGIKNYLLSLIELLARSCHEIAARLFRLDGGVHKHSVYEAWRNAPVDPLSNLLSRPLRLHSVFCHRYYSFHDQYPHSMADVAGYWAEVKIFGGVVVFDRGPSCTEGQTVATSCPLPIKASQLNGYRYHPHDAISRFNIFRDRYERNEPPAKSTHRIFMDGRNWPEMGYDFQVIELHSRRSQGVQIDEAELAAAEEGRRRITQSSPYWPYRPFGGEIDPDAASTDSEWVFR